MSGWYLREPHGEPRYPGAFGTSLNPLIDHMVVDGQTMTSLDEKWEQNRMGDTE